MYFDTSYRSSGASALVNYIEKDYPLRNSAGRELSQREVDEFVDKSKQHQFERELQIAPNPYADVSRSQLERETRRMIGEFTEPAHSSVTAAYAVHDDNGVLHAHVALTGKRRDLFMDAEDVSQVRDRLEQQIKLEQERKQRLEQGPKHEWELAEEQGLDLEPELAQEQEQKQGQDHDFS